MNDFCIFLYKYQIFNGCENENCENLYCLNNKNNKIQNLTLIEKENLILKLINNKNKYSNICKNLPIYIKTNSIYNQLYNFKKLVLEFFKNNNNYLNLFNEFLIFLDNPELFKYLLLSNDLPLSFNNSSIDDLFFEELSEKFILNNNLILNKFEILINNLKNLILIQNYSTNRFLLILFYFPIILNPIKKLNILFPLINLFLLLPKKSLDCIENWLSKLFFLRKSILNSCHFAISLIFSDSNIQKPHQISILNIIKTILIIYNSNKISENPFNISLFYNHHINESIDLKTELEFPKSINSFTYLNYPFILSLKNKNYLGLLESKINLRKIYGYSTKFKDKKRLHLKIRRSYIIEDSINQLLLQSKHNFLKKLKITFLNEKAIDLGGPSREFLYLLSERLFSSDYDMFTTIQFGLKWFSKNSFEGDRSFFLIGAVLGLSLHNRITLPLRFPLIFYKKLISINYSNFNLLDLKEINLELANSLNSLLLMKKRNENISELLLNFEIIEEKFDKKIIISLSNELEVNNNNVEKYINLYIDWELNKSIESQFLSFKRGFDLACPEKVYRLFEPSELEILISGEENYDWENFKRNTKYNNCSIKNQNIIYFWEIFNNFNLIEKKKFLLFISGNDRSPPGGLINFKMTINLINKSLKLPISHTCFNILDLPNYNNKEILKKKLLIAIYETEGFGFL